MLQQTPVARVAPAWVAFLCRFPSVTATAASPLDAILRQWARLGYPRRARDLWRGAHVVVEEHGGAVPSSHDALRCLPGIGPYTAAAIMAFAFGDPDSVPLDINVRRVARRVFFLPDETPSPTEVAGAAARFGPGPTSFQALMDVGALFCRARVTRCEPCPLRACCLSAGAAPPPALPGTRTSAPYEGSRRQARGQIMAVLRVGPASVERFDSSVLDGLVRDGLVELTGATARLCHA